MVRTNRPLVERMTLVWHDWFATSNDGVGVAAPDDPPERALPQAARSARSTSCCCDVTRDPAMLLWLSGADNTKDAPNENYGRELMELFTLGAGRGYTEHDVREQARALTGFRNDWDDDLGPEQLPLRPRAPRRRREAGLRQARAASTGATRAGCASSTAAIRRSSSRSSGRTSSRRAAGPQDAARARAAVRARATTRCARWSRRSCATPPSTEGPRMVKPPVVYIAGPAARHRARRRHRVLDLARPT